VEKRFCALGRRYRNCADKEVRNLARVLFEQNEKFFVFIKHQGVEPTNNRAEHAERTAVQWRKISFGNRSNARAKSLKSLIVHSTFFAK